MFEIPQEIKAKQNELNELVKEYPLSIPPKAVATFLGMDDESLRTSIDNGKCPFALSWQKNSRNGRRGFYIPTFCFFWWFMKWANIEIGGQP